MKKCDSIPEKYERCVCKVKAKSPLKCEKSKYKGPGCYNPWAICTKTVGRPSYYSLSMKRRSPARRSPARKSPARRSSKGSFPKGSSPAKRRSPIRKSPARRSPIKKITSQKKMNQ